mgnify:CR=1 FL=1
MYNIIKNPETDRNVSIYSKKGIAILEKYLNNLTGGGGLNAIKNLVNKPTETFELQHIPDKFKSNDYQSKLETIINIINSPHIENYLQKIELFINIDENKKYLYKNMVLFLFTLNSEKLLIKKLFNGQNFKIYINKINNNPHKLFLKHINIKNLKKNNWNDKVKNLIYRFHLTNIISVLLILINNLSNLIEIAKNTVKSLGRITPDFIMEEAYQYFNLQKELYENIRSVNKLSEKNEYNNNVKILIKINSSLKELFSKIIKLDDKATNQILQGCMGVKLLCNLTDAMETSHF